MDGRFPVMEKPDLRNVDLQSKSLDFSNKLSPQGNVTKIRVIGVWEIESCSISWYSVLPDPV